MILTQQNKIIISIVTIAILFGGYVYFDKKLKQNDLISNISTPTATSTTGNSSVIFNGPGYIIEQVPITEGKGVPQPIPDLNRPVQPNGSAVVSADAVSKATQQIVSTQAILKKNPGDFNSWIGLGSYQKMAGDYIGASISWTYASKLAPKDYVSLGNLANLYAYFIHDNTKAEMYYTQALIKGGAQSYLYTQFAEFYRDVVGDNIKAKAIVDQGLSKIPNDPNLLQFKSSLN